MGAQIEGDFVVFIIGARIKLKVPLEACVDLGVRRGCSTC